MKVAVSEIEATMHRLLAAKGFAGADIPFIINMYLGGELRGHTSHGLASFPSFLRHDFSGLPEPVVLKATHALYMVDAKSNPGTLVGRLAADEAMKRARQEGFGAALINNMDSWLRPGAIAEYIAGQDLVAIVLNSGGGVAVAPPGGYEPVLGTDPIAYGVPTEHGALVVDMATAKRAWGQVRLANKYGTDLPPDTFYDDEGNVTLDPEKACAVMPFGEYKGFALTLLVEVLTGSLVGMPMMVESSAGSSFGHKMPERGGVIIVIDPSLANGLESFKRANSELIDKIKATKAHKGEAIRIPGEKAAAEHSAKLAEDTVEIPDQLWQEIQAL